MNKKAWDKLTDRRKARIMLDALRYVLRKRALLLAEARQSASPSCQSAAYELATQYRRAQQKLLDGLSHLIDFGFAFPTDYSRCPFCDSYAGNDTIMSAAPGLSR